MRRRNGSSFPSNTRPPRPRQLSEQHRTTAKATKNLPGLPHTSALAPRPLMASTSATPSFIDATISTPQQLADALRRSGGFDSLRRSLMTDFMASVRLLSPLPCLANAFPPARQRPPPLPPRRDPPRSSLQAFLQGESEEGPTGGFDARGRDAVYDVAEERAGS